MKKFSFTRVGIVGLLLCAQLVTVAGTRLETADEAPIAETQDATALLVATPPGAARCIAWQPGGSLLATSGDDTTIKFWRADGTLQSLGLGHDKSVRARAWSGDGQMLASRGSDATIRLWNPTTGEELASFSAPSDLASALVWTPSGDLIADGPNNSIVIRDAKSGKVRRNLMGHRKPVRALALAPDGKQLASAGGDGDARIWDLQSGVCRRVLSLSDGKLRAGQWLEALAWNADGTQLAAGGDGGVVRVWDARDGRLIDSLSLGAQIVGALCWDGNLLRAAGDKGDVAAWDGAVDEPQKWQLPADWKPLAWNDAKLVARDEEGAVRFFDAAGVAGQTLLADSNNPLVRAALWNREGVKLINAGRYADGVSVLKRAHEWAPESWRIAGNLSWALGNAQEFSESSAVVEAALERAPNSHARREMKRRLADAHYGWGRFLRDRRDWRAAIAQHEISLRHATHIADARAAYIACLWIAENLTSLDQPEKAIELRVRALNWSRKTADPLDQASALRSLGDAYNDLDRYAEALRAFWQSHEIYLKAGNASQIGVSFNQLGLAYNSLGDNGRALRFYRLGLEKERATFDFANQTTTMGNIALTYLKIDRPDMAAHERRKALEVARRARSRSGEASQLAGLAVALARLKRFDEAKILARQAVEIEAARGDRASKGYRLRALAEVLLAANEPRAALPALHEALWIARQTKSPATEANVAGVLMKTWRAANQPELAIFYGKRAVNLRQNIRSSLRSLDADLQGRYARSKEADYRELADLLIARGRLSEAGEILGLLKQQEFLGFVRRDANTATAGGQSELGATETGVAGDEAALWQSVLLLSQEKSRLVDVDEPTFAQSERLEKVNAELKGFEARYQTFLAELPARFVVREAQTSDLEGEFATMQDILADLSQSSPSGAGVKAAALYTLVAPDRVRVIFVGPYGAPVPLSHAISSDDLNRKVFAFHDAIKNRQPVEKLAQELYKILFCDGQLEKQLRASGVQTLMWSLDGALRYIPLGALHDGKGWLVERYAQSTFSAASLGRLKDAPATDWTALGLGVSSARTVKLAPYEAESFDALPGVLSELRGIVRAPAQGWSGGVMQGQVLIDDDFDLRALKQGLKQKHPILHIATHFRLRARNAESYLLLGKGEPLTLDKLPELSDGINKPFNKTDLVVFSACQTALGGDATSRNGASGVEVDSLGTIAQKNGAKAVLATLWSVADNSTSELMQNFYKTREDNAKISKAEALRRAQLMVLRDGATGAAIERGAPRREGATGPDGGRWSHPYFWAPFVLSGNWR